jgi:hypothetical protein
MTPGESSTVNKTVTFLDKPLSEQNPLTPTIECDFCNQYLPGLGRLIHDQVSGVMC